MTSQSSFHDSTADIPPHGWRHVRCLRVLAALAIVLLVAVTAFAQRDSGSGRVLAITHVNVIDTATGSVHKDMTVVIRRERIVSVAKAESFRANKSATVVDGREKFLIPGLWDVHVHLSWTTASALPLLIANGVTSVRDLGGKLSELDDWRSRISANILIGPRIYRAGPILNGKSFNQYQMVPGNPDETRGVVRGLKEAGVDFIKVHRRMPRDSYFAAIDETKKLGIPLVGHIPMSVTPAEASDAGQFSIEHVATLFEGTFSASLKEHELPAAIRRFREKGADELFADFAKNHTVFDPTLAAYRPVDPAAPPDPRSRYVARSQREAFTSRMRQQPPPTAQDRADEKETFAEFQQVVRLANRAGVTIVAGTDIAGPRLPGFTLHEELAALVESGLSPLQALQAATLNCAQMMNKSADYGSVQAGKIADLMLLEANPLDDIHNTQRIRAVIVSGKLFRREDLDGLLRQAEQLAAMN